MTRESKELKINILRIFSELRDESRHSNFNRVQKLIDQVTDSLTAPGRKLGPWEISELNYAKHALNAGFSKLALISAGKALAVQQLLKDEYAFGLRSAQHRELKAEYAKDLLSDQKEAADVLSHIEKESAQRLRSTEESAATELGIAQRKAASALIDENLTDAITLARAQVEGIDKLEKTEAQKTTLHKEREQVLSWMTGGYSVDSSREPPLENAHVLVSDAQKRAAQELKDHQHKTATDLKENQTQIASDLKETRKQSASSLKAQQKQTSRELAEAQATKAINKMDTDNDQK